jgi:catecholate siderophore receptor
MVACLAVPTVAWAIPVDGLVVDTTSSPIPGAVLTASPVEGNPSSTTTDQAGRFRIELAAGSYELTIEASGFTGVRQPLTVAAANTTAPETYVLDLIGFAERIDVEAADPYQVPSVRSATKTPTLLRDVPQSVSVVSGALIADQRMQGMADVVRYMPGVGMSQGEGNRDTPIFRGNSSTSDFYVDGVRDDLQYFRDTYNVDRVEALKGPNGMIFGRGGSGGVINRVTRQAEWGETREISLQLGSWDNLRATADVGQGLTSTVAARVNALYEDTGSYRDGVQAGRVGANPTLAWTLGPATTLRAGYEFFRDQRTADRGISSFAGRPLDTDSSTFMGDPDRSDSDARLHAVSALLEHNFSGSVSLRSRLTYGDYDKFYQNVFPGAVSSAGTLVNIQAYNNDTQRQNLFEQTDLVVTRRTGAVDHTLLVGLELGRQDTDNFRNTGFFTSIGPNVTNVLVPIADPTTDLPLEFRQGPTDADNHGEATVGALYLQDQIAFSPRFQAVIGLRYDQFNVDFDNHRTGTTLSSDDGLLAPRIGLIYKPVEALSLYGSYGLSYLPRAGEQLSSLSATNRALDPEEFTNYELGAKWDISPKLGFTGAVYRLKRGNVAVPDPVTPSRSVLVDAQRADGVEIGLTGRLTRSWTLTGGYAYQDGEITESISATARAGATLANTPRHSASLWNRYDFSTRWGIGLGLIYRGDVFTSTDNLVTMPGYKRFDAALFYNFSQRLRAQINVENLADEEYFVAAQNNTNITPGSPRAVRLAISSRF